MFLSQMAGLGLGLRIQSSILAPVESFHPSTCLARVCGSNLEADRGGGLYLSIVVSFHDYETVKKQLKVQIKIHPGLLN